MVMITDFDKWASELECELQERGIELDGCDADWQIWFERGMDIDDVIAAYRVDEEDLKAAEGDFKRKRMQEEGF